MPNQQSPPLVPSATPRHTSRDHTPPTPEEAQRFFDTQDEVVRIVSRLTFNPKDTKGYQTFSFTFRDRATQRKYYFRCSAHALGDCEQGIAQRNSQIPYPERLGSAKYRQLFPNHDLYGRPKEG